MLKKTTYQVLVQLLWVAAVLRRQMRRSVVDEPVYDGTFQATNFDSQSIAWQQLLVNKQSCIEKAPHFICTSIITTFYTGHEHG